MSEDGIDGKRVLAHICCAPCSIYTVKSLRLEGARVEGFFYNPNIHPYREFKKRLVTLEAYGRSIRLPLIVDKAYDLEEFLQGVLHEGSNRCLFCYRVRMERTFRKGQELGVDGVTTTLLYSKYQRHDDIRAISEELSVRYGLPFVYRDFRVGWSEGVEESKRLDMYRQPYCGCVFSEKERYMRS